MNKRIRFEILRRDNHACRYCGAAAPDVKLTVDHVIPVALGGTDTPENLVTACAACNSGKTSTTPDAPVVADVGARALEWAEAMKFAANILGNQLQEIEWFRAEFDEAWEGWGYEVDGKRTPVPLPVDAHNSIDEFCRAGLPIEQMLDAVGVTMRKSMVVPDNKFRYFCGVCWKRIHAMQEIAASVVGD